MESLVNPLKRWRLLSDPLVAFQDDINVKRVQLNTGGATRFSALAANRFGAEEARVQLSPVFLQTYGAGVLWPSGLRADYRASLVGA